MPDGPRVIAHVGYHKTASTLIQRRILTPDHGFHAPWPIRFHFDNIVAPNPYADRPAQLRATYSPALAEAQHRGLTLAISHEALLGNPFDGGNRYARTDYTERLAEAFPSLVVVVVIREQVAMIASLYKHSIAAGHTWDAQTFLAPPTPGVKTFGYDFLHYAWPLLHLRDTIGADRVRVVPFEWLKTEPIRLTAAFAELGGQPIPQDALASPVNRSLGALGAKVKRQGNRLLPTEPRRRAYIGGRIDVAARAGAQLLPKTATDHERRLAQQVQDAVGVRYAESNRALADTLGLDLGALGYRV